MSPAGPRTQPLTVRPWNGTETRLPVPASCSSFSTYVNGRSTASRGTATQTSTAPARASGRERLLEGAAKLVDPVGLFPGEALAPEVPVGGRLPVDGAPEVEVVDDRRRPEVEQVLHDSDQARGIHPV